MIHVSIHDVSPAWEHELERAVALCAEVGAKPALLVVPDFHGKWRLDRYPGFVERLQRLQDDGHEVLLHGFHHLAQPQPGPRGFFAQRVMSAGEAEFAALDPSEAERLLDAGLEMLTSLALHARGFVPPAWQARRWLLPLLAARGLRWTEDHLRIRDPVAGTVRPSLVLNYASRTPARLWSSLGFVRAALPARNLFRTRIAIHPADLHHDVLVRETRRVLSRCRGSWAASTAAMLG